MVASDGGIFSFGDAFFHGSMGGKPFNKPSSAWPPPPTGSGRLVASDGESQFRRRPIYGSAGGTPLNKPAVGVAATPDDHGYWIGASDGGIFNYGDANFYGSEGGIVLNKPVVGVASASYDLLGSAPRDTVKSISGA